MSNMLNRFKQIIETVDESDTSKPSSPAQQEQQPKQQQQQQQQQQQGDSTTAVDMRDNDEGEEEEYEATMKQQRSSNNNNHHMQAVTFDGDLIATTTTADEADQEDHQAASSSGSGGGIAVDISSPSTVGGRSSSGRKQRATTSGDEWSSPVSAMHPQTLQGLLKKLAAMEEELVHSNLERQQLQCRLEEELLSSSKNITPHNNNNTNVDVDDQNGDVVSALKHSLAEQVERADTLGRDFQSRIVECEFARVQVERAHQALQEKFDELERKSAAATSNSIITIPPPEQQRDHHHHERTKDEEELSKLYQQQLEARLVDAQRKNDRLQKTAAESLERAAACQRALQQDLDHTQTLLAESRQKLKDAERPVEDQLEAQLKSTPVFSKIQQSAFGSAVTNVASKLDRVGVLSGQFLSGHAMLRLFVVVYVILLHLYIFHLFAAVFHSIPVAEADVHAHLEKHGHLHGHHH